MKCLTLSRAGGAVLCIALLLLGACGPSPSPTQPVAEQPSDTAPGPAFQRGFNYTAWAREQLSTLESDRSLENLADTGANWVAIVVLGYQQSYTSTLVTRDPARTPSDEDIVRAVATAHGLGLKVMLKPHIDLRRDPDHWRGDIGEAFADETQWRAWFDSYAGFVDHYAALAQELGVEQFCVGTELVGTTHRETEWREVIAGVRERFVGSITYAANHSGEETRIAWWDAVDIIGIDAYYVLTDRTDFTVDELKAAWVEKGYVDTMTALAEKHGKPVLVAEIGYRSVDGAVKTPWDWDDLPLDLQEQADAYRAALEVLWGQPWLAGIYWWNWDVNPQKGGPQDKDYTPYGKPAEDVLRTYYGGAPRVTTTPTPLPTVVAGHAVLPASHPAPALHPGWISFTDISHINDLDFDAAGNLWIATPGGLLKWDRGGGAVTRYTTAHGLASNWVETVTVAPDGVLWIGTDAGVSRFDGSAALTAGGRAWTTYTEADGLASNAVTSIAVAADGALWVGTFGAGVSRFGGSAALTAGREAWTTYNEADGLLERHVLCAAVASDGAVWFGTWRGASRFDGRRWTSFTTDHGLVHHGVESIAMAPDGAVWFGTWNGISRLNGNMWSAFLKLEGVKGTGNWIETVAAAPDGTAWAATRETILRFDDRAWEWEPVLSIARQPDERGPVLAFDPDGGVWVGAYDGGIYHFDGSAALTAGGQAWAGYALERGLAGGKVTAVAVAPDGAVWIGARPDRYEVGGGVSRLDGSATLAAGSEAWTTYTSAGGLASNRVNAVAVTVDGAVWAGTDDGVSFFDGSTWTTSLAGRVVRAVVVDRDGAVWAGTTIGLLRFDGSAALTAGGRRWVPVTADDVRCLAVAPDGTLWVGTAAGLSRFDGLQWTAHLFGVAVDAVAVAADGTVWAGTPEGVSRFGGSTALTAGGREWTAYTVGGLGGVRALAVAPDGAVWAGSRNGAFRFDGSAALTAGGQQWSAYTAADGLAGDDVRSIAIAADGTVWIGTDGGVSQYVP